MVGLMQKDLNSYHQWCLFNKLSLNTAKTKLMLFSDRKRKIVNYPVLKIDKTVLGFVENYCYLGIMLDRQLNFKHHYSTLMSTLQHKILLLCKIRPYIDTYTAVLIYKSHILSYLEYGSIFLDGLPIHLLQKLQRAQNKSLRICYHVDKTVSNVELHQKSKLLPLRFRRASAICKFFFKKNSTAPWYVD